MGFAPPAVGFAPWGGVNLPPQPSAPEPYGNFRGPKSYNPMGGELIASSAVAYCPLRGFLAPWGGDCPPQGGPHPAVPPGGLVWAKVGPVGAVVAFAIVIALVCYLSQSRRK